ATFRAKFKNNVRADVGRPDIILGINPHGVRGNKEIIGDATKEFPGRIKLHQRMFAPMEHVDMALGVYRYTSYFDEMLTRGQLKEIGNHFVIELWNLF